MKLVLLDRFASIPFERIHKNGLFFQPEFENMDGIFGIVGD